MKTAFLIFVVAFILLQITHPTMSKGDTATASEFNIILAPGIINGLENSSSFQLGPRFRYCFFFHTMCFNNS